MRMKRIISALLIATMVLPMLFSGFALPASGDDTTGPATIPLLTDAATPNTVSDYRTESLKPRRFRERAQNFTKTLRTVYGTIGTMPRV